jgi:hypothetical protein
MPVLSCQSIVLSPNVITDAFISPAAGIQYTKNIQKFKKSYAQPPGSAVVAATLDLHVIDGATGFVLFLWAAITGAIATGSDRTVNVDLQRSTGGGAFSTVLSSTIQFNDTSTLYAIEQATISASGCEQTDVFRVIVTVAGSAAAQAQGLIVEAGWQEQPQ